MSSFRTGAVVSALLCLLLFLVSCAGAKPADPRQSVYQHTSTNISGLSVSITVSQVDMNSPEFPKFTATITHNPGGCTLKKSPSSGVMVSGGGWGGFEGVALVTCKQKTVGINVHTYENTTAYTGGAISEAICPCKTYD